MNLVSKNWKIHPILLLLLTLKKKIVVLDNMHYKDNETLCISLTVLKFKSTEFTYNIWLAVNVI